MKDCSNCGMRSDLHCLRSGRWIYEQRTNPDDRCDKDFSGWIPEELKMSWWERIWRFFK